MYCGNNAQDPSLIAGDVIRGTRYKCLKKGIGVGKNQDVDPKYLGDYAPIDTRKIWCGNSDDLPAGYDRIGNLPHCLQKGIGVGKKQKAQEYFNLIGNPTSSFPKQSSFGPTKNKHKIIIMSILYLCLIGIIFMLLYFIRPSCVTYTDNKGIIKISTKKFIIIYIPICLLFLLVFIYMCYQSE